jgi:GNAT superfamily N-acetyltransferase
MTSGTYSLAPADSLNTAAMTVLRRIYEEGFPPYQRDDFAAVTEHRRDGELALALLRDGEPCGFAMLRPLGATGWMYLRYFVVDTAQRGQGLGGLLWDHLVTHLRDAGATLLVFDVDDPDEPGCEPDEVTQRRRRIRFYERHGARLLPVTGYRAPDVAPGAAGWSPMLLLTAPLAGPLSGPRPGPDSVPDADEVRAIVEAVFRFRWELEPGEFPPFTPAWQTEGN